MVNPRFVLGVAVFAVALVGGLLATWSVAVCTHGPREKVFAVTAFSVLWALIFVDVILAFWLPKPWCYVNLALLAPLAAIAAYGITMRSLLIREYEERHARQRPLNAAPGR
ncbi:MAG: hypothetical protein EOM20_01850 [Spartobacteria bacterium]|nr:hypothetical protein [Spartobacteria bacterium]